MPTDEYKQSYRDTDFDKSLYVDDEDIIYKAYDGEDAMAVIIPLEYDEALENSFSKEENTSPKHNIKLPEGKADIGAYISSLVLSVPSFTEHTGEITVNLFKRFAESYGGYIALPFILLFNLTVRLLKKLIKALAVNP